LDCTVQLEVLGLWEFRVEYQGIRLAPRNQYALINELAAVDPTKSLMLPMDFNVYEPYYQPEFGMSQFLKVKLDHGEFHRQIVYKVLLRDKFLNPIIRYSPSQIAYSTLEARINPELLDQTKVDPKT
jgi:hypothetical protein